MLEVKIHDRVREFRLDVRGALDEAGARELFLAWRTGLSTVGDRPVVVRLREVTLGQEGAEVLALIVGQRGELLAEDRETAELVARWTGISPRFVAVSHGRPWCERLCGMPLLRWWCCAGGRDAAGSL